MTNTILRRRCAVALAALVMSLSAHAHLGWPASYGGVMLQGFYWDSFTDSQWSTLESQADELAEFFSLVWVPQSGNCNSTYNQMGYSPVYFFNQNSSFGTEAQLRSMIKTFKAKGIGTIEDVVINHHNNIGVNNSWLDFASETYNGVTYQLQSTDVVADDDNGKTSTWAAANGFSLSSANDTGEGWDGMRDLDHTSTNVQNIIKVYLDFLLNDLGYTGFRYDMTKGYSPYYTRLYNDASQPAFSVGENWTGDASALQTWLNGTKDDNGVISSATFDFPFRYTVRDAVNNANSWRALNNGGLNTNDYYKQFSVTFVENHDTQYRDANNQNDPIKQNIAAANAYMLAMPGTPCVFLKHWQDYKEEIKQMIYARHLAGVTNTSATGNRWYDDAFYVQETTGTNGGLVVMLGDQNSYNKDLSSYVKVLSGTNYSYWLQRSIGTAWASKPSGTYYAPFSVTLTAVAPAGASLVYTTDGTEPTAQSATVASGGTVSISKSCTLKVALLQGGQVSGTISRDYTLESYETRTATVYLKDPGWGSVHFYAWDANGTTLNGSWPGDAVTAITTIRGQKFYYMTFPITSPTYTFSIIFDQGSSDAQTVDIGPISKDTYYEISETNSSGKYTVTDITSSYEIFRPHMPLTASDFAGGKKHYFLVGTRTADWRLQPEWELHDNGSGTYTLPKRLYYTGHMGIAVVDNYDDYCNQTYTLYGNTTITDNWINSTHTSVSLSAQNSGSKVKADPSSQSWSQFEPWAQVRFVATSDCGAAQNSADDAKVYECDPTLADLSITLGSSGVPTQINFSNMSTDVATTNKYLTWSFVGSMTANDLSVKAPLGGNNWEQGWIQYDANGKPYVDGDGHYLYQTCYQWDEWLKDHPSYFTYNGTQYSSANLVLHYDASRSGLTKLPPTGSTLLRNTTTSAAWTDVTSTGLTATNTTTGYACYVADDVMLDGTFKLWTGWGGVDKQDDGTKTGASTDGSQYYTRWYYRQTTHDYNGDASLADYSAYYKTATDLSDSHFTVGGSTYFKRVEFYLDPSDENNGATAVGNSALRFYLDDVTPLISAWCTGKLQLSFLAGMRSVTEAASGYTVTGITINRYTVATDGTRTLQKEGVLSDTPASLTIKDLDSYLGSDPSIDGDEIAAGLYQYEIVIAYTDGDGTAQQATACSNVVRISDIVEPAVTAAQRTEDAPEGTSGIGGKIYSFDYQVTAAMPESLLTETYLNGGATDYVGNLLQGYEIAITSAEGDRLDVRNFQGVIIGDEEYDFANIIDLSEADLSNNYKVTDADGNVVARLKRYTAADDGESYYTLLVPPTATSWKMPTVTLVNLNAGSATDSYAGKGLRFSVEMLPKEGAESKWQALAVDTTSAASPLVIPQFGIKVGDLRVSSIANYYRWDDGEFGGYTYPAGSEMYAPGFDFESDNQLLPCTDYRRINVLQDPITVSALPVTNSVLSTFSVLRGFHSSTSYDIHKGYTPGTTTADGLYQNSTNGLNAADYTGLTSTLAMPTAAKTLTSFLDNDESAKKLAQEIGDDDPSLKVVASSSDDSRTYAISTTYSKRQLTDATDEGIAGNVCPDGFAVNATLEAPTAQAIETAMKTANGGIGLAIGSTEGLSASIADVKNWKHSTYQDDDNGDPVDPVTTYDTFFNITSDDLTRPVNLGAESSQLAVGISAYASNFYVLDHPDARTPQNYTKGGLVTALRWSEGGIWKYNEYNYTLNDNLKDTDADTEKSQDGDTFADYMATGNYSFSDLAEANGKLPMRLVCSGENTLTGSQNLKLHVVLLTQYPFSNQAAVTDENVVIVAPVAKSAAAAEQSVITVVSYATELTADIDPTVTGVSEVLAQSGQLRVWPRPACDVVNVAAGTELGTVELYSVTGQLLKAVTATGTQAQLSVAHLPAGVYVLRAAGTATRLVVK